MKEIGTVLSIEGETITFKGGSPGACVACSNHSCQSNGNILTARNDRGLEFSVGDTVEIENPLATSVGQGLVVLLPPFVVAALGYILTMVLAPKSSDPLRAAVAMVGLIATFFAIYWIRKLIPTKAAPQVIQVLPQNEFSFLSASMEPIKHMEVES